MPNRARKIQSQSSEGEVRPDVFKYHDCRSYLRDWLASFKAGQSGSSLRTFAEKAGMPVSSLSMVLKGTRKLTLRMVTRLSPVLGLSPTERSYLELLVAMDSAESHEEKVDAFNRMRRLRPYKSVNPSESSLYHYLAHWYHVAIRELSTLPGFRHDAEWIRNRLRFPVEAGEIERALRFLVENHYIAPEEAGGEVPLPAIDCAGEVHRLAMAEYHRAMFGLATQSIASVPREQRNILGYTLSVDSERFERIRAVLDEAQSKIRAIAQEKQGGEEIWQVELALFPLTGSAAAQGTGGGRV